MKSHTTSKPRPSWSEQRQIENEVVFRKANERIQDGLIKLEKLAKREGHETVVPHKDLSVHFCCECSDENCRERIVLTLEQYQKLHTDRRRFIVVPAHETAAIEEVVSKKTDYEVVEKFVTPPEAVTTLSSTSVNNV